MSHSSRRLRCMCVLPSLSVEISLRRILFAACLIFLSLQTMAAELTCSIQSQAFDSQEIACAIPVATEFQHFEFVARFSGGHDDTRASIEPAIDGKPLSCSPDSKLELFGEYGDVSVYCRFTVPSSKNSSALSVTIRWSHAQYTDFELVSR